MKNNESITLNKNFMNLFYYVTGFIKIKKESQMGIYLYILIKLKAFLLTISDPWQSSITLNYPEPFIHIINLPFMKKLISGLVLILHWALNELVGIVVDVLHRDKGMHRCTKFFLLI